MTISFSFGGCAWLLAYHIGAGKHLQDNYDTSDIVFLGASSGSLSATIMASGGSMEGGFKLACDLARDTRTKRFLSPIGRMTGYVKRGMNEHLPKDAYKTVAGKLIISVTEMPRVRNLRLPDRELKSNDELLNLLLGSCYIPIYYERPVFIRGRPVVDGGLTDNFPKLDANTVIVSPYPRKSVEAHVFPKVLPLFKHAMFPETSTMERLYEEGQRDCESYLSASGLDRVMPRRGTPTVAQATPLVVKST